jgi:uncharacterized protein YfaS (alpha-2-macroglobulin family)
MARRKTMSYTTQYDTLSGAAPLWEGAKARTALQFNVLVDQIESLSAIAKSKIAQIRSKRSAMSIADMFDLQMSMNKLQQFSELSTSVISAMHTSINSMARNIKG